MKSMVIMVLALFSVACSQKLANYDYDTGAPFQSLERYVVEQSNQGSYQSLDSARVEQAIHAVLSGRYEAVSKEQAQFTVGYWMEEERKVDQSGVSFGFGVARGNLGVGVSTGPEAKERVDGKLVLSITNSANQMIWQAKATQGIRADMSPERREELIQATVSEMLSNFPPQ